MRVLGGYDLDPRGRLIRQYVDLARVGDHGADPLGDTGSGSGYRWRMVPSGDIVDRAEMRRRLDTTGG